MISLQYKKSRALALQDIVAGTLKYPLWMTLGWNDIKQRYRRSLIGPFWLTASMGIMVLSLGIIYARIFNTEASSFIPYLCTGLLVWNFLSSVLSEAGTLFVGSESYIKQIRLPFSVYVYRFMWSRLIIFAHNFVIYLAVIAYFAISPGFISLIAIVGIAVIFTNGLFVSLYLGMMSARFRDLPQIVTSVVQIVFFVTPIMWKPEFLSNNSLIVRLNPFFHLIEIVRSPLLGREPTFEDWISVFLITIANLLIAGFFFIRFRSRIPYWV